MPAFMKKFFDMLSPADSEDYDELEEKNDEYSDSDSSSSSNSKFQDKKIGKNSKVINMGRIDNEISCFKPTEYNKSIAEIADSLKSGCIVIIDFGIEENNPEIARRIIDFLSGAAYFAQAKFFRVANNCILAPNNVKVNGLDLVNELKNYDILPFGGKL